MTSLVIESKSIATATWCLLGGAMIQRSTSYARRMLTISNTTSIAFQILLNDVAKGNMLEFIEMNFFAWVPLPWNTEGWSDW